MDGSLVKDVSVQASDVVAFPFVGSGRVLQSIYCTFKAMISPCVLGIELQ
jgi:hypothetical protein